MTAVELSDPPHPIDLYERALHGHPVGVQLENGTRIALQTGVWSRPRAGDSSVIRRCRGATLDVGCGSGRFTEALARAGTPALGVDISPLAIRLTRSRGSAALLQDIFARTPTLGLWHQVLLMDGNVGIGGDAVALLARCRELLCPGGTVLVEVDPPGSGVQQLLVQLVHAEWSSRPFRWLTSDANGIKAIAATVGLAVIDEWGEAGRWFVELGFENG
jgi:SAM-dependent methyltransferase